MAECIHGTESAWCGICTKVDQAASPATARASARTKQVIVEDICRALGIELLAVYRGSSVPVEIFQEASRRFGVPMDAMPAVGRAVALKAGLDWTPECDSTGTPSGGGSTVTAEGLEVMLKAIRRLSRSAPTEFDVDELHELLAVIPSGRWTTYKVIADLAGTGPRGLGSHVRSCPTCQHAWRVLEDRGTPSPHFVWSDPAETRSPRDVLESEGLLFEDDRADPAAFISGTELADLRMGGFRWPTVEWVKDPVDLATGDASGRPIRMRHFHDCRHWYDDGNGQLVGDPPRLATDSQMRVLAPCADCKSRAERDRNPGFGVRPSATHLDADATEADTTRPTDVVATTTHRYEQTYLRGALLDGRATAACDLCGRLLPSTLLVAAHITPRSRLTESERYDFHGNAMLACLLGCDALFERGLLTVMPDGLIQVFWRDTNLVRVLQPYAGQKAPGFSPRRAHAFQRHLQIHEPAECSAGGNG